MQALSKQTCTQCRQRKVRCDGDFHGCSNCRRLGFACSYHCGGVVSAVRPLRGRQACMTCRDQKTRCSSTLPSCFKCRQRGSVCTYLASKRQLRPIDDRRLPLIDNTPPEYVSHHFDSTISHVDVAGNVYSVSGQNDTTAPSDRNTLRASSAALPEASLPSEPQRSVEKYFSTLYPLPSYAFLHPASTLRKCRDGKLKPILAHAIEAIVALPSRNSSDCEMSASAGIEHAERDILMQLDKVSTSRLQALLLVIHYHMETGSLQKAFMLVAIAARFATAMRLNHEQPGLPSVQREEWRRMLWSLKLMERYFSIGLLEFELCPFEAIYLDFPANEKEFCAGEYLFSQQDPQQPCDDHDAYQLSVKLEIIRRDIMKFSRCIALGDGGLDIVQEMVGSLEDELAQVSAKMTPLNLTGTDTSDCIGDQWLTRRVFLQLSLHQCHCDLSRLMLRGYAEAAPPNILERLTSETMINAERRCWTHALSIVRVITSLNEQSARTLVLEFDTAICTYHAVRVLLYIASQGSAPERGSYEFALSRAHLCIAALKRFFTESPLVKPIIEELVTLTLQQNSLSATPVISHAESTRTSAATTRLSSAAKAKQRLAIHSLLARGQFDDDEGAGSSTQEFNYAHAGQTGDSGSTTGGGSRTLGGDDWAEQIVGLRNDGIQYSMAYGDDTPSPLQADLASLNLYPWLHV